MRAAKFHRLLGANVRKARWLRGLTQQGAAEAAQLNLRYYQEIERGTRNPTVEVMFVIATALRIAVADLMDVGDRPRLQERLLDVDAGAPKRGRKAKPTPRSRRA